MCVLLYAQLSENLLSNQFHQVKETEKFFALNAKAYKTLRLS